MNYQLLNQVSAPWSQLIRQQKKYYKFSSSLLFGFLAFHFEIQDPLLQRSSNRSIISNNLTFFHILFTQQRIIRFSSKQMPVRFRNMRSLLSQEEHCSLDSENICIEIEKRYKAFRTKLSVASSHQSLVLYTPQ